MICTAPNEPPLEIAGPGFHFDNRLTRFEWEVAEMIEDATTAYYEGTRSLMTTRAGLVGAISPHGMAKYKKPIFATSCQVFDAVNRLIELGLVVVMREKESTRGAKWLAWACNREAEESISVEPGGYDPTWIDWKEVRFGTESKRGR